MSVSWVIPYLKNERAGLGVGLGLYVVDLDTKLMASGEVNGVPGTVGSPATDITARLPDVRAFGTFALTPKAIAGKAHTRLRWIFARLQGVATSA